MEAVPQHASPIVACLGGAFFILAGACTFRWSNELHDWELRFAERYLPTFLWIYENPDRANQYKIGGLVFIGFGIFIMSQGLSS